MRKMTFLFISLILLVGCDIGNYDYCVEWNNNVDRDDLFPFCYNLEADEDEEILNCEYEIDDEGKLLIKWSGGGSTTYNCVRYAKTKGV